MISTQDRYIGITKIENELAYVNKDKSTCVCASDIAGFIDEYYPELFESIASDDKAYARFNWLIETTKYYSYAEIAADYMADIDCLDGCKTFNDYDPYKQIALDFGYETFEEFEQYALIISDSAIDGFLVMGY